MFDVYYTLQVLTVGLSFVNVIIISFDRHYALDRPLVYITRATKTGGLLLEHLINKASQNKRYMDTFTVSNYSY